MYVYVRVYVCVLITLPLKWSGRNKVYLSSGKAVLFFLPLEYAGTYKQDIMCVGEAGMCARACMYACVCVHVCAGSHKDRKMIWFINYVMMQSINYIILSTCLSVVLSIYLCTHTYAHTHEHLCVCVCLDALTLYEEKNSIYLRLSHLKR